MEISTRSLGEAYKQCVQYIYWNHTEGTTEDNEKVWRAKESIVVHVNDPLHDIKGLVDLYPMGIQGMNQYKLEIMGKDERDTSGTSDDFAYTYHDRMRKYEVLLNHKVITDGITRYYTRLHVVDQIRHIIDRLKSSPNTRRAVAITWRPYEDNTHNAASPPCLQWLKFEIVDNHLNMYTVWRSRDALLGMGANIYALHDLHIYIAHELNVFVGFYEEYNTDAHIYYVRDANYLKLFM